MTHLGIFFFYVVNVIHSVSSSGMLSASRLIMNVPVYYFIQAVNAAL